KDRDMTTFTRLQRRILSVLEEPGGYDFAVLTNTVANSNGAVSEIDAMSTALIGLANTNFVELATARDPITRRGIALPKDSAFALLSELRAHVNWSAEKRLWTWTTDSFRCEVMLTEIGIAMAQQILSEEGYPERPLESYE